MLRDKLIKLEDIRNQMLEKPKSTRLERRKDNKFSISDYILAQKNEIPGLKRMSYRKDRPTMSTTTQEPVSAEVPVWTTTVIPIETTTLLPNESTSTTIFEPVTDLDSNTIDSSSTNESANDGIELKADESEQFAVTTILPSTEVYQEALANTELNTDIPENMQGNAVDIGTSGQIIINILETGDADLRSTPQDTEEITVTEIPEESQDFSSISEDTLF